MGEQQQGEAKPREGEQREASNIPTLRRSQGGRLYPTMSTHICRQGS
jgi:hypothetical protein